MEHKRSSVGFVLTTLLAIPAPAAYADDLPPPPPPPPGANQQPPPPTPIGSGVLDAPPPPPPGVTPPTAPTSTPAVPTPAPTELAPPPTPPPGTDVTPPKRKPKRIDQPARKFDSTPATNTHPEYESKQSHWGKWYGWKSMIGLVPVYGLFVGGIVAEESTLFIPAAIGGLLVTPIAHWTHGNRGRGWVSFGLNLGAPMLGLFVAGGYGALAGFGLWNVVDVAALHYERKPAALVNRTPNIVHSWAIVPMMDHGRRGIGLVGQF